MAINPDLFCDIACIICGGDVEYSDKKDCLECKKCQKEYKIIDDILIMGGIDDRFDDPESQK